MNRVEREIVAEVGGIHSKNRQPACLIVALFLIFSFVFCIHPVLARQVGVEKAKQVAANWINEKAGKKADVGKLKVAFTEKVQGYDAYHVINYPSGGWAIVAGDDVAQPIIAYSYDGTFSVSKTRPPQFERWMENIKNEVHEAIQKQTKPIKPTIEKWDRLAVSSESFETPTILYSAAPPLLSTTWNQNANYNSECPEDEFGPGGHVWAGCVATAMAQVMKYHNWPDSGMGSHAYTPDTNPQYGVQSVDFSAATYDWDIMPDSLDGASSAAITAVATLIYHCGVSVDMNYTPTGSGANMSTDAVNALTSYFKFHPYLYFAEKSDFSSSEWISMLQTEINNGRPVLYEGSGTGGHAFICDGFGSPTDEYFHFNWGWGGSMDGYFLLTDLTPYDRDYTNEQGALLGVRPFVDLDISCPYMEGFESGLPEEWGFDGDRISLDTSVFHSDAKSLLLGTEDGVGYSVNTATLILDVPLQGSELSFWVKRGYASDSPHNQQIAQLISKYGETVLHTFYDGDFNDSQWQEIVLDLTPWAGSQVRLYIEQYNSSGTYAQWTYVDDISITCNPVSGSLQVTLQPTEARNAGAQWRRTGTDTWLDSGATENDVPAGSHVVEFKTITGWDKPGNKSVTIFADQTATATGTYSLIAPAIDFTEDFESCSLNTWPAAWIQDGNASDETNNYIAADPTSAGNQVLRLFGETGSCLPAIAFHPFTYLDGFYLAFLVYNGDESLTGCNPVRGEVGLRQGSSGDSGHSRRLISFLENGDAKAADDSILGNYALNQWHDVLIHYQRAGSVLTLAYTINGALLGEISVTVDNTTSEQLLDHIGISAQEGMAYFDDIHFYEKKRQAMPWIPLLLLD